MDQFGNVIGSTQIAAVYSYGVIKNIQWINPVGTAGYAQATITLMDGTDVTKTVTSLNGSGLTYTTNSAAVGFSSTLDKWVVSTSIRENDSTYNGTALYRISEGTNGVTLDAVALPAIAGGRLKDANVQNKQAYVSGTIVDGNLSTIITDESTQYLVGSAIQTANYKCTAVTGVNNIGNYSGALIDYVDVNNDGRADYVYLCGSDVDAVYTGLFYPVTLTHREVLKEDNHTVDYYVMTGYVDGSETVTELIIPAAYATAARQVILDNGANKLYKINFVNGNAVAATLVTGATWIDQNTGKYSNPDQAAYYGDVTASAKAYFNAGVLTVGGYSFYVTDATNVYGNLTEGIYDNHNIYVVYTDTGVVGGTHYATEIYVSDKAWTGTDGTTSVTDGTVIYNLTMYMPDGSTQVRSHTWTGPANTYANQNLATIAGAYWTDINLSNWNILLDQSSVTVAAGQVSVLNYIINAK